MKSIVISQRIYVSIAATAGLWFAMTGSVGQDMKDEIYGTLISGFFRLGISKFKGTRNKLSSFNLIIDPI